MIKNKFLAFLLLAAVVLVLGHSLYCLIQGKFQEAMIMTPVLVIAYIFGVARKSSLEQEIPDEQKSSSDSPPKERD